MKIRYKLYILLLLLAVVPLAVVGYISYVNAKDAILEQQTTSLQSIVESRVFDVEILIELRKEQARLISGNYVPRQIDPEQDLPADVQALIQGHIDSTLLALQGAASELQPVGRFARSFIERIEIAGLNGRILASTDEGRSGIEYDSNLSHRLAEEGTFFDGYRRDDTTGKYFLTIVSDVTNIETGELSGAVILYVHPGILQEIAGSEPGLKYTGEMFIVDLSEGESPADGARIIAGKKAEFNNNETSGQVIYLNRTDFENPEFLTGIERDGLMRDHLGQQVLAASRDLPGMNWRVVGKIEATEVFEPVSSFLNQLLMGLIAIAFISFIVAYVISSSAAGLIENLDQTFSKLSRGKLSTYLDTSRKDEFGDLARSANQTTDYLKRKIEDANRISSGSYREEVHRQERMTNWVQHFRS
jgi:HAMP domain-containing protein